MTSSSKITYLTIMMYLSVIIEPIECQICYTDGLPVIRDLLACTIDNPGNFIRNDELQVLSYKLDEST